MTDQSAVRRRLCDEAARLAAEDGMAWLPWPWLSHPAVAFYLGVVMERDSEGRGWAFVECEPTGLPRLSDERRAQLRKEEKP